MWDGLIGSLPGEVAVRYDLPGFGTRSGAVADACASRWSRSPPRQAEIVSGIGGPVIVVGQSLGTQVAELVAAQHPDRVRGLVLLTPVPLGGTQLPDDVVAPFRALGGDREAQRACERDSRLISAKKSWTGSPISAPSSHPRSRPTTSTYGTTGCENAPTTSAFGGPVMIVRGGADAFVTEQIIDAISPRFAGGVDVEVINDGGHWVHVEYPEKSRR